MAIRYHGNEVLNMLHKLRAAGLPNIYLAGGVATYREDGETYYAYSDLDGLYQQMGRSVALESAALLPEEFLFLRKRLGWTQDHAGLLVGKSAQAIAKWEKGQAAVPVAESKLLRLAWLHKFSRKEVAKALGVAVSGACGLSAAPAAKRVFEFDGEKWSGRAQGAPSPPGARRKATRDPAHARISAG